MGRSKFRWENLPERTQIALAHECGLNLENDDPAVVLETAFRSRPQDWFVTDCWPQLRRAWLAHDDASRALIVSQLQDNRLGDWQRKPRTAKGQLDYLATCQARQTLRRIVLARFIEIGSTARPTVDASGSGGDGATVAYARFRTVSCDPATPVHRRDPFEHQQAAWDALDAHRPLRGLLVLPTGAGKTFTATHWLLQNALSDPEPRRVLWLAHRAELLEQAAVSFSENATVATRSEPLDIRAISGKHGAPVTTLTAPADVTLCTVQALFRHPELVAKYFTMYPDAVLVIDEAHHAAARSYRDIVTAARNSSRRLELLGLTATPTRTDPREIGLLNDVFRQGVLYQVAQADLIERGILSRPIVESVATGEDFESAFTPKERQYVDRFGDLHPETLRRIARSNSRNGLIVDRYMKHREVYGKTMVFATAINHAYGLTESFLEAGARAAYVASVRHDTQDDEAVLSSFRNGDLEVLVSVAKLTEGFDAPSTNAVFLTRPTGSLILLKQMIGRGMRGPRAGGEHDVRLVSFDDHWDRFTNWLEPMCLFDQPLVAISPGGKAKEIETRDIPWSVVRELSKLSQQSHPYASQDPAIGWYEIPLNVDVDSGSRAILVWEHQTPGYEQMISAASRGELRTRSHHRYFEDVPDPLPSTQNLRDFARYIRANGVPPFVPFEDSDKYSPAAVASCLRQEPAHKVASEAEALFDHHLAVRQQYGNLDKYLAAIHRNLDRSALKLPSFEDHPYVSLDLRARLPRGRHDLAGILRNAAAQYRPILEEAAASANRKVTPFPKAQWSAKKAKSRWAFHRHHDTPLGCGIVVNRILQTSAVSTETLDFLLYHELLHHALGNDEAHSGGFRDLEQRHPGHADAAADLDSLVDRYRLNEA